MISHHAVMALLERVIWDRPTPVPRLWLGAQEPWWAWDGSTHRPLLVSAVRIRDRRAKGTRLRKGAVPKGVMARACCPVFRDSGAFSWLTKHTTWTDWPAHDFAAEAEADCRVLGTVEHAGIQDWMCEPEMLQRTGLTVEEHQRRTIASLLELRKLAPTVPWLPTLQGFTVADYLRCAQMYEDAGVRLDREALVGLGSVCRRSGSLELEQVIRELVEGLGSGVLLHGFGVKDEGAIASLTRLASLDSEAWSDFGRGREKNIRIGLGLPISARWPEVLAAWAAQRETIDLDLEDLIIWRDQHAPGGLANSQTFAERWRVRQLAKMCARLCEQADGAASNDPPDDPYQIEMFAA